MPISDFRYLVGSYDLSQAGYDAGNARITDRSSLGNHWAKATGTPVFTTRGGIACQDFSGAQYYERSYLLPVGGSFIAVIRPNLTGGDGAFPWLQIGRYAYGADDHTASMKTSDWATYRSYFAYQYGDTARHLSSVTGIGPEATTTPAAWQIVSGAWTPDYQRKIRINDGAVIAATETGQHSGIIGGEVQRLGYTTAPIATAGSYFSIAELILVRDDIFANQLATFNAVIAEMRAQYVDYVPPPVPPSNFAGLALWLDAADATTLTTSGSAVTGWNDKSGNSRNTTQATALNQPTLSTAAVNGKNAVAFTGSDPSSLALGADLVTGAAWTIFIVARRTVDDAALQYILGGDSRGVAFPGNGTLGFTATDGGGDLYITNQTPGAPIGATALASYTPTGMFINGVAASGYEVYSAPVGSITFSLLGRRVDIADQSFTGLLCEVLVYEAALSTDDRHSVEAYLKAKWGIA